MLTNVVQGHFYENFSTSIFPDLRSIVAITASTFITYSCSTDPTDPNK